MGELAIDGAGRIMDGDEVFLDAAMDRGDAMRIASCVHGRVLEGGLGWGRTNDALRFLKRDPVTVEIDRRLIDLHGAVALKGRDVIEGDVRDVIESWKDDKPDSCLLDVPDEVLRDPRLHDGLRKMFDRAGDRVAVIADDVTIRFPGFHCAHEELPGGRFLLLFDRFEPEAGLGVLNPHGDIYVPGFGWKKGDDDERNLQALSDGEREPL